MNARADFTLQPRATLLMSLQAKWRADCILKMDESHIIDELVEQA
jgi:hypothetical protein